MKKRIVLTLLAAIVGLFTFTGCEKETPFSIYQIGTSFEDVSFGLTPEEIEKLPVAEQEELEVADYLASWLISNRFIMTGTLGNPIVFEGADEAYNDERALVLFANQVVLLNKADLDQIVIDGQNEKDSEGKAELVLTTSGTITFKYYMTKGSIGSAIGTSVSKTVNYGPL